MDFRQYTSGETITEPGAYVGVPMEVYHGQPCDGPSISSSGLRTIFGSSLAHYWDTSPLNEDRAEQKDSRPMILGRAAHHLLLGERDFWTHFVLRPKKVDGADWHSNRKACKDWLAEQKLAGLTVVTEEMLEQIRGMSKALAAEPAIAGGMLNGHVEVSMFWRDHETGIWLKSRPDNVPYDSADSADLKCVGDTSDGGIERGLADHGYHQQGALIREGFQEVLMTQMQNFFLVYAEADRPHSVRIETVPDAELAAGYEENHAALRLFKHALETGHWPGPKNRAGDGGYVWRPSYARSRAEERVRMINASLMQ